MMIEDRPGRTATPEGSLRIAITGLGVCSPIGVGVPAFWEAALAGVNGIREIRAFPHADLRTHVGGEIDDFAPREFMSAEQAEWAGRGEQLAVAAARMAVAQAGLAGEGMARVAPERRAVSFGSFGESARLDEVVGATLAAGWGALPHALVQRLPSRVAHAVAAAFDCRGSISNLPALCAAGNYAIGYGADLLRCGRADVVLAGGSDAFSRIAFVGFNRLRATAPDRVRPFDLNRGGMILAEGAGALVLERLDRALARGATVLAELLDYGLGCDAHNVAIPHPEGRGGVIALRQALARACLAPEDLDYVSAHGTGTRENDRIETRILKEVLGAHARRVKISSLKSMVGHTISAASAIEAVACVQSLRTGWLTPTINYETPDPDCDLDYVPNVAQAFQAEVIASNAYAFGGNCATLLLRRFVGA